MRCPGSVGSNSRLRKPETIPSIGEQLSAEEVRGLAALDALVDRVQPTVAVELLDVEISRVAMAAVDLNGVVQRRQPLIGGP